MANMTPQANDASNASKKDGGGSKTEGSVGIVARATEDAASLATDGVRKTRARWDEQVSKQREQLTGKVRTLGRALHGAGEMLEEDNTVAHGLNYASEKITRVADYIAEVNPSAVMEDLRDIARRQPMWFYGGSFTLGLLLARFAKSTADASANKASARSTETSEATTQTSAAAKPPAEAAKRKPSGGDVTPRAGTPPATPTARSGGPRS